MRSSWYLWDDATHQYEKALKLWEGLSRDLNYNTMFSQRGVMNVGHSLQDMRDINRRVNANRLNGVDGVVLSPQQVKEIPGPRGGWLTVYILAPIVGALAGGGLYRLLAGRLLAAPEPGSSA